MQVAKRNLDDIFENDPLGLLDVKVSKSSKLSEEAIYYGTFQEILHFLDKNGREPSIESENIHEAKLAARLEKIRSSSEAKSSLEPFDSSGILHSVSMNKKSKQTLSTIDEVLSSSLLEDEDDIFNFKHVTVDTKKQSSSDDMAKRTKCLDFEKFESLFKRIQLELDSGIRRTEKIEGIADIKSGQAFVLYGLIAYVAEIGEKKERRKGHHNARMRVIYSNGMESNILLRSFGAALYKDSAARAITGSSDGSMFDTVNEDTGLYKTGVIYVLRSKSEQPEVKKHQSYLHKIGVTKSDVKRRVANAAKDPTYLLADVEIVAEYTLHNMNPNATEKLLHAFFRDAQADIKIPDRFGSLVQPKEWFFLPLELIKQAVRLLNDGTIADFRYDSKAIEIVRR
jgi:hypothetical protein